MLCHGSGLQQLCSRPCIPCNAQQAAVVRPHLALLSRDVRTSFRVSGPSDAQNNEDDNAPCEAQHTPLNSKLQQETEHHPAHSYPLKNAQLGHSRFSRGAPHICYGQVGTSGVFYIKPEVDELVDDWQQWVAEQQQQWAASQQQPWQQQRQQIGAWMHAQQERFAGPPFLPGCGNSTAGDTTEERELLLRSMRDKSGAVGSVGIAVSLAAAVVAALKGGCLHSQGSGQRLFLGAIFGFAGVLLLIQCSKWLVAALLLCYAGICVL